MATVSQSLPEFSPVQRRGLVLVVVGLLVFLAHPVVRLATFTPPVGPSFGLNIVSPLGACVLVWGAFVLRTGDRRPLTPRRALLIPILVFVVFAVVDVLTSGQLVTLWESVRRSWPDLSVRTITRNVHFIVFVGSSAYVVLGSAVRARRRRVIAAFALVLVALWFVFPYDDLALAVLGQTLIGIVPFAIGYRATSPPEDLTPLADILLARSAAEWRGLKLTAIGLVMFAPFPILRLTGSIEWRGGLQLELLLSTWGACILVWGLYVIRTETKRPLTPKRALLIPLLVVAMAVATDLLTRGRLIEWWVDSRFQGPLNNLDVFGRRFQQLEYIGASIYAVLGAATRSEQWPWVLLSVVLILCVSWMLELIPYAGWMFVLVAILGIVPAIIGYRAAPHLDQ